MCHVLGKRSSTEQLWTTCQKLKNHKVKEKYHNEFLRKGTADVTVTVFKHRRNLQSVLSRHSSTFPSALKPGPLKGKEHKGLLLGLGFVMDHIVSELYNVKFKLIRYDSFNNYINFELTYLFLVWISNDVKLTY